MVIIISKSKLTSNPRRHIDDGDSRQLTRWNTTRPHRCQIETSAGKRRRRHRRSHQAAPDGPPGRHLFGELPVPRSGCRAARERRRRRGRRKELRRIVAARRRDRLPPERRRRMRSERGSRTAVAWVPRRRDHHRRERVAGRGDLHRPRRRGGGRNRLGLARIGPIRRREEPYFPDLRVNHGARSPARVHRRRGASGFGNRGFRRGE